MQPKFSIGWAKTDEFSFIGFFAQLTFGAPASTATNLAALADLHAVVGALAVCGAGCNFDKIAGGVRDKIPPCSGTNCWNYIRLKQ